MRGCQGGRSLVVSRQPQSEGLEAPAHSPTAPPAGRPDSRWAARYGQAILRGGIAAVPRALFYHQAVLGLSAQEVWFVAAILARKWDADLPHPSLKELARQAGLSVQWLCRLREG